MAHKHLLSISEFSKLAGIPRSKLIYYDDIGLFSPVERGENNYRYYSLDQIITASFISDLASFGVPLKQLTTLAPTRTPEMMIDVLQSAIEAHQKKIAELKETQNIMDVMSTLMTMGLEAKDADIQVMNYEPYNLVMGNENSHQDAASFFPAWLAFMNSAKKAGINIKYPVGGYFESMERWLDNPAMPSCFYFVNPRGNYLREGGKWLAGFVRGAYSVTQDLPQRMLQYALDHNLELTGPVFNTFLLDEMSIIDPNNYLMRASIKIVEE